MKIGILTCARLPELLESDQKLIPLFAKENISAKAVIWDDESVDWSQFDYLIFRNTWDYYQKEEAFNSWLNKIKLLGIKTFNPISVIQKNKHKFYLKDLEKEGISILPTIFLEKNSTSNLHDVIPKSWEKWLSNQHFLPEVI
jgi:glutathione synthase/RimK-type ligase-like ATP-grasp enzyme